MPEENLSTQKRRIGGKTRRAGIFAILCGGVFLLFALAILPGQHFKPFLFLQLASEDELIRRAPKPNPPFKYALIGIDASSRTLDQITEEEIEASRPLQAMAKGYPWSRMVTAAAIEKLMEAGARLVFVDILMIGPREGDDALKACLEKYKDRVVLVSNFAEDSIGGGKQVSRYQTPSQTLQPAGGANVGFANFWRDVDGKVRTAPFHLRLPGGDGEEVFSVAAISLDLLGGQDKVKKLPQESSFIPDIGPNSQDVYFPLWQLFVEETWKSRLKDGEVFKDRVIAIGDYSSDLHDEFETPLGQKPGMLIHLTMIGAAWENALYHRPSLWASVAFSFLGCLIAWVASAFIRSMFLRAVIIIGVTWLILPTVGIASLTIMGWMLPMLPFGGSLMLGGIFCIAADFTLEYRERQRTRETLERYVSPNLAREILDHRANFLQSLGGARREVTIAFSDLRGFTSLSEHAEATELLNELNEYLGSMVKVIFAHGGGVDKFLGDGIMAVWGNISSRGAEEEAIAAVTCAQEMQKSLNILNVSRVERGLKPWHAGIGLHSGNVIFGNVGSLQKMEPTVIGDTVNLASRTEGLTKQYGANILFTESTADLAAKLGPFRSVDRVKVVGRVNPVGLFAIWADEDETFRRLWKEALSFYRAGRFEEAVDAFHAASEINPEDSLCRLYVRRSKALQENPPKDGWDGVFTATLK